MIKVIKKVDKEYLKDFIYKIDIKDENLYTVLEDTPLGIFQFSGKTAEGVTERVKPKSFEDMVAVNGFARPGTIDFLPQYLENKETGTSSYPDKISELLEDTHGTIIFQEQAMRIFNIIGGFTLEETNNTRGLMKRLGKADKDPRDLEEWDKVIVKFEQGAIENGLSSIDARKISEDMLMMSEYSFNRSHSVAYSYNALITMYLTYYFRKYFYSAIIEYTMDKDRDDVISTLKQIKSNGYNVFPPNINTSKEKTYVENNNIFIGIRNVKQVGEEVASSIVSNAPYKGFFDFLVKNLDNNKVNKRAIGSLIKFGVFDELETSLNRKQMINAFEVFWETKRSFSKSLREEVSRNKDVRNLIETNKEVSALYVLWENCKKKWSEETLLTVDMATLKEFEFETMGFNFFISPFTDKEVKIFTDAEKKGMIKASFNEFDQNNISWKTPVFINKMRIIKDRNGNEMAFTNIEDLYGNSVSIPIFASFWKYLKNKVFEKTVCLMILYRNDDNQIMLGANRYIKDEDIIHKFVVPVRNVYK
jgi:DNA polymerase-3 subunit alpha